MRLKRALRSVWDFFRYGKGPTPQKRPTPTPFPKSERVLLVVGFGDWSGAARRGWNVGWPCRAVMREVDQLIFTRHGAEMAAARKKKITVYASKRIDETASSSYCWQPFHLRHGEKVPKIAPAVKEEVAKKRGMMFFSNVRVSNAHRLRQCTERHCSAHIHHRDASAAAVMCIKLWMRLMSASSDPQRRALVNHLVSSPSCTPPFMARGAKSTRYGPAAKKESKKGSKQGPRLPSAPF